MQRHAIRLSVALATCLLGVAAHHLVDTFRGLSLGGAEREVLAVEREYIRAHVERDVAALDRVLADDFSMFGGRVNKERRLAFLSNPFFVITSLKTDDVEVVVSGKEAWVNGTASIAGRFRKREFSTPRYGFTRKYEKRGGRWQIVSCEFGLPW